jgi:hypothetical protein
MADLSCRAIRLEVGSARTNSVSRELRETLRRWLQLNVRLEHIAAIRNGWRCRRGAAAMAALIGSFAG